MAQEQREVPGASRLILLTTVFHSGTHSLQRELGEVKLLHCCEDALRMAQSGEYDVYTTYRDPYEIAASWISRGKWPKWEHEWVRQWKHYHLIKPFATVVDVADLKYHDHQHKRTVDREDVIRIIGESMSLAFQ